MNQRQKAVLGGALAVLGLWAIVFAPYKPSRPDSFAYPPPRHPLFWPGREFDEKLDAERAAVEIVFICVFGSGLVLVVADRHPKEKK
jgi:hypothetical protein